METKLVKKESGNLFHSIVFICLGVIFWSRSVDGPRIVSEIFFKLLQLKLFLLIMICVDPLSDEPSSLLVI
jgi:hypothetical protein